NSAMALKSLSNEVAVVRGPLRQAETLHRGLDRQRQTPLSMKQSFVDKAFWRKLDSLSPDCARLHGFEFVHDSSAAVATAPLTRLRFVDFKLHDFFVSVGPTSFVHSHAQVVQTHFRLLDGDGQQRFELLHKTSNRLR